MSFERFFDILGDIFNGATQWIESRLTILFGSANARYVRRLLPKVAAIAEFEPHFAQMTDEELRGVTAVFRKRLAAGETLDDILVEAFAACRESAKRQIGLRHYDVQMLGGMVLHSGAISEMMTGEGKTLVATLPAYLNAIAGKGVHIVTVNDYLARRDMEWMGPVYLGLGVTVGAIQSNMPPDERQLAYKCDITYGTNNEFGFDYLRDNMKFAAKNDDKFDPHYQQAQGRLNYAIIDEVDNILIDEARTPLIISGAARDDVSRYKVADQIARQLRKDEDFVVNEKEHSAHLTDEGVRHAEHLAGVESFYTAGNMEWPHLIDNALKAHHLFKRDVNYVVMDGTVVIVDEFTGRLMEGRQWSDGLHQAVEAKENVTVKEENQTLATITLQNFFKLYDKLAGMTGTAMTEASEFWKIYRLDVIAIPTNKPLVRVNNPDVIYKTEREKYIAIVEEIERINKWDILELGPDREVLGTITREDEVSLELTPKGVRDPQRFAKNEVKAISRRGRPILVGTVSIEKSELLSTLLDKKGVKHQLLNAKPEYVKREAEIVAQAGRKAAVTIATNMAGRGTDIILGGNPESLAWGQLQSKYPTRLEVPRDEWNTIVREIEEREQMRPEGDDVRTMGGLHIIGTERHEARRIDLQLRGRCARQGDPGSTRFFLSLEDDLMRIFAGEWVKRMLTMLGMEDGTPIESKMVTRRIEGAQRKVEERHFESRKNLLEYDEVMDFQRKSVYGYRQRILEGANTKELVGEMLEEQIDLHLKEFLQKDIGPASFAAWAGLRLACELDAKDFRGMTFTQAEEFATDSARRLAETQVLDAIDENLPDTDDETEWNWKALASFAESRWKLGVSDTDLKKIGRDKIDEFLIEKARQYIDGVELREGAVFLEQDYSLKTVVVWAQNKFGIVLDPEAIRKMEFPQIRSHVASLTWQRYAEKEIDLSLSIALRDATVHESGGSRFDRERLVAWAVSRFGAKLTLDDIKGEQHDGIVKIVSERCHAGHRQQIQQREELRAAVNLCLRAAGFDPEQFRKEVEALMKTGGGRAGAGSRFAARSIARTPMRYSGKYASQRHLVSQVVSGPRLTSQQPELVALCEEIEKICGVAVSPDVVATWEPQELEDRAIAIWEDRYHPEMRYMERSLILQVLDSIWKDHLLVMEQLRSSVGLRGYAQVDPKVEYKREGMKLFTTMWNTVFERVTDLVFRMEAVEQGSVAHSTWRESAATHASAESGFAGLAREQHTSDKSAATQDSAPQQRLEPFRRTDPKVGRNDPCPCGSGKKYKHCHLKQQ